MKTEKSPCPECGKSYDPRYPRCKECHLKLTEKEFARLRDLEVMGVVPNIWIEDYARCWIWLGKLSKSGNAAWFKEDRGGYVSARRVVWERETGETLKDQERLMMKCEVPRCINPAHMKKLSGIHEVWKEGRKRKR